MTRVELIAQQLKLSNIVVKSTSEGDEMCDGEIALTKGYHVQVGDYYLCLNKTVCDPEGNFSYIRFILEDTTVEAIVKYFWEKA